MASQDIYEWFENKKEIYERMEDYMDSLIEEKHKKLNIKYVFDKKAYNVTLGVGNDTISTSISQSEIAEVAKNCEKIEDAKLKIEEKIKEKLYVSYVEFLKKNG